MVWAIAILGVGLAAGLALIWQLLRQNGRILLRLETLEKVPAQPAQPDHTPKSLPVGAILHDFELPLLDGGSMTFSQWLGRRFLVMFVDPACAYCQSLASRMNFEPAIPTLIVTTGDREHNRALFTTGHVLLQEGTEVAWLYHITATPCGYLVDERGAAACELLVGAEALLAAMKNRVPQNATSLLEFSPTRPKHDGLKEGTPAPDFTLPQLNGQLLSLSSFLGHHVLLVFWDPACDPCLTLAPKLEEIHRASPGIRVLMVTRGGVQANCDTVLKLELTFPIAMQKHWEISRLYGTLATPVGYLVGPDGRLRSDAAVGGSAILGLFSNHKEQSLEQTI